MPLRLWNAKILSSSIINSSDVMLSCPYSFSIVGYVGIPLIEKWDVRAEGGRGYDSTKQGQSWIVSSRRPDRHSLSPWEVDICTVEAVSPLQHSRISMLINTNFCREGTSNCLTAWRSINSKLLSACISLSGSISHLLIWGQHPMVSSLRDGNHCSAPKGVNSFSWGQSLIVNTLRSAVNYIP